MPRSYDLNPVQITHHPTQRIDTAIGKLPPFDIQQIIDGFLTALKDLTGIDLTGIRDFLENLFGTIDWSNLPDAGDVWAAVVSIFIRPLNIFAIPADVQERINESLGDLQDALDGSYSGSGPIFLAVQELAQAWLTATSPLNSGNLFGRIALPQFGSGVPLMALTTAVPNELEPFSATSVPSADGWSWNAVEDAAQVVCDGSTKALYLKSGVIKVEVGQPLDTSIDVKYSGIVSGAGQTIRYVLETFTSADGSGTATPVIVGAVSNPSGPFGSSYSVTVDHANVDAGLTGFPVRVDLADMPAGFWATVADGGGDIRCHVAGVEVPREVVACDTATDTGELWVKVDLSPTVDTVITVTADGSSADYAATATYGRNAVWSNGFGLAMHTHDVADLSDVTGNGFDGVAAGGVTQDGDMLAFSGSGSSVTFPAGSVPTGAAARTVSAWVDTASTSDCCFWGMGQTGVGQLWEMARWGGELIYHGYGDGYDSSALDAALGTGLHHVALSYDGTVVEVFIDGVSRGTSTPGSALSTVADHNILGAGGFFTPFVGSVGEPRLSTVARSDAWVAAEFANRQAGFYGVSGGGSMSTPVLLGDSSWDVPPGVGSVRPVLVVDELVTAGTVFWLNTPVLKKTLAGPLADGLPAAIQDRIDDFQAMLDAFKGAAGGTIADIQDALDDAGQHVRDAIANAMGHSGSGHSSAQIATYLANIPQGVVTGLSDVVTQTNQIVEILAGNTVTAINSTVQAVKDWFSSWFGGGSSNAIPLSQKGAASGVAPLNSSTKLATSYLQTNVANGVVGLDSSALVPTAQLPTIPTSKLTVDTANNPPTLDSGGKLKTAQLPDFSSSYIPTGQKGAPLGVAPLNGVSVVPLEYLPEEVGGSGGSGDGRPYVILALTADQTITSGGLGTEIVGWSQSGSAGVTFEDGTYKKWKFNQAGWWQMEMSIRWAVNPNDVTGKSRHAAFRRYQEASMDGGATWAPSFGNFDAPPAPATVFWQNIVTTLQRVSDFETAANWSGSDTRVRFSDDDYFSVRVRQDTGSSQDVAGGYPYPLQSGSFVVCTYLGAA